MKRAHFTSVLLAAAVLAIGAANPNASVSVVASTVPGNGDVNPYGVAVVQTTTGSLVAGDILVSNFNDKKNLQGTGTTIVEISPGGAMRLFAHIDAASLPGRCPGGVGLTTALSVTSSGWVFVGSLPTADGSAATARPGCIIVLNSVGQPVETFWGSLINGPWDMTALDGGSRVMLFVTNVLNGTQSGHGHVVFGGTVVRIDVAIGGGSSPRIASMAVIGSRFPERTDPAALVIGPTGVSLSPDRQTLYVADSLDNRIAAISNPMFRTRTQGLGTTVSMGGALNDPLGLTTAPNGDILSVNGNNGFMVRTSSAGVQLNKVLLDSSGSPPGAGALFGLAAVKNQGIYFVDDATNTLDLFH